MLRELDKKCNRTPYEFTFSSRSLYWNFTMYLDNWFAFSMVTIFLTQVMTPWALSRCIFCAFEQTSQKLSQTSGNNGCWTLSRCYAECRFTSLVAWFGCWLCVCSILGIQNSFRVSDLTFHEQIHSSIIADLQSWGCFRVLGDHLVNLVETFLVQLKFRNCFKCLKAWHGIHSILSVFFVFFSALRKTARLFWGQNCGTCSLKRRGYWWPWLPTSESEARQETGLWAHWHAIIFLRERTTFDRFQ